MVSSAEETSQRAKKARQEIISKGGDLSKYESSLGRAERLGATTIVNGRVVFVPGSRGATSGGGGGAPQQPSTPPQIEDLQKPTPTPTASELRKRTVTRTKIPQERVTIPYRGGADSGGESWREKQVREASERLQKEIEANIRRERERLLIPETSTRKTQPERDIQKAYDDAVSKGLIKEEISKELPELKVNGKPTLVGRKSMTRKEIEDLSYIEPISVSRIVGEKTPLIKDIIKVTDIANKKYSKSQEIVNELNNPNITEQEFNKKLKEYKEIGGRYTKEEVEGQTVYNFQEPTIRLMLGNEYKNIPVSELVGKGLIGTTAELYFKTTGETIKQISRKAGLKETGVFQITTPEKTVVTSLPYQTRGTSYFEGEYKAPTTTIVIPEKTTSYITPSQLGKVTEFGVRGATFVPTYYGKVGESILVGKEFGGAKDPIQFAKQNKIETAIMLSLGALKGYQYLRKPIITKQALKVTGAKPTAFVGKPSLVKEVGGKTYTYYDDLVGYGERVKGGSKTIVSTKFRELFRMKPLYEGVPYVDKAGYESAYKLLIKKGYTKSQAKELLRLRKPLIEKQVFKGEGIIAQGDETKIILKGTEKTETISKTIKGVKTAGKQPTIKYIKSGGEPLTDDLYKFSQETRKAFLKGDIPYSKVSQAGKTTERFNIITGAKETGQTVVGKDIINLDKFYLGKEVPLKIYKEADIVKRIVPETRKLQLSKATVYVEQGTSPITITKESLKNVGFKGGAKSSKQLLQLSKQEQALSSGLQSVVKTTKTTPTPKIIAPTIQKTTKVFAPVKTQTQIQTDMQVTKLGAETKELPKLTYLSDTKQETKQEVKLDTEIGLKDKLKYLSGTIPQTKTQLRELQQEKLKVAQALKLETKQKEISLLRSLSKTKTIPEQRPIIKPTIKIPIVKSEGFLKSLARKTETEPSLFKVFTRKAGQDIEIGKTTTKTEATGLLLKRLKGTLRASGFVTKNEKPLSFKELNILSPEFRPSKKSSFRVVQRKEKRLGTKTEVGEIQFFKKKKIRSLI